MSMTIQTTAKPIVSTAHFAPPRAALAMPKQVLTASRGSFLRSLRASVLALVAPGLRRLG